MFANVCAKVRLVCALAAGAGLAISAAHAAEPKLDGRRSASGLPLPRFVSLRAERAAVRQGPGVEHRVLWVFNRAGLPLEIIQEWEGWRQIRDHEGAVGWVAVPLLWSRRTAIVLAWESRSVTKRAAEPPTAPLRDRRANEGAGTVVLLEAGVLVNVRQCDGRWCTVTAGEHSGEIEQSKLWGVYPGEVVR